VNPSNPCPCIGDPAGGPYWNPGRRHPASPQSVLCEFPFPAIRKINRQRVANAEDAIRISQNLQGGRVLLRVWSRGISRYLVIRGR
jgi:hypothetical protein